ncbi:MAG TPA: hypothetical protein PLK28_04145 [Candidatus Rifleibacterium sp.]|nr:hypothetical protein [Candidatus Rifleibacterium sp.]
MRCKKVGVLLLFLLVILTIIPSTAKDKKRNMAMSLLRQARAAHDSGDHEKAQNLLLKAKFIWKDLPDPGWSLSSYHETGQKKSHRVLSPETPVMSFYSTFWPARRYRSSDFLRFT